MPRFKVIAINEICNAVQFFHSNGNEFIYSPLSNSDAQKKFNKKRYIQIKQKIPQAIFEPNKLWSENSTQKIFSWNSFNEKKYFKSSLMDCSQNRLFSTSGFTVKNSFTHFKNQAEKLLPNYFDEAIQPFDEDVKLRIQHYFYETKLPSTYFETRNGMVHSDDSSRFSSYLSSGSLDVKYLYNQIKNYEKNNGSNKSTYWLVFELLWREFFYWHYQSWQKAYFSSNGIKGPLDFSNFTSYSINDLKTMSQDYFWQASLLELETTGFQTNRTRQLFASFWIHELGLHWRAGAKLFEDHLIDYDVFSNWGNWMYLAGVGADSRGSRRFNIKSQLDRYDKEGEYFNKWK